MSGRYLLDTNIIIALFADESFVKDRLAQANEVFLPIKLHREIGVKPVCFPPDL